LGAVTTPPRIRPQLPQLTAVSLFSAEQEAHFHPVAIVEHSAQAMTT
jgi:hypothetical protein